MRAVKQAAIALLAGTQLALLIVWNLAPMYRTAASIPAAALSFLASLGLLGLSSIEHSRSVRPSSLINTYMLFSLLFDLPQARTLWLRPGPRSIAAIFTVGVVAKTVVLYLEARSKGRSLSPPYRLLAPESIVSVYDRTVLWWLNPLFLRGYRSTIGFDGLYKIDASLSSETVEAKFQHHWARIQHNGGKRPLFWAILSSFKRSIVTVVIPRLCLSAFTLCQPLLINRVTLLLSQPQTQESTNAGRGLIGVAVLIYLGLAISRAIYQRQLHRLLAEVRGAIVTATHAHTLLLSSEKLEDGATLTLITADVRRITFSLQRIDDIFATPCEVAVAVYLLQEQIGVSCVAPIAVALLVSGVSFINSNSAIPMQQSWLAAVQERVTYTASVLACPKGFKMLGLTDYLFERIQSLRVTELVHYAQYRKYVTWRNLFSAFPETMGPPITLMMFTLINGSSALDTTTAFTTLALVVLLSDPIRNLIHAVPNFQTALASSDRVQEFLLRSHERVGIEGSISTASSQQRLSDAVELRAIVAPKDSQAVMRIDGGAVRIGKANKLVLSQIDLAIERGSVNLVIGPVGCGKSTLLKTILGDHTLTQGVRIAEQATYAYCAQDPWLPNSILRDIVIGKAERDDEWYSTILWACALSSDLTTFPQADDSVIGNKGVSLSGGQRSRLALARALYARYNVLVVDDVLSGLDANTSQIVFDRVFGPSGLCKKHQITAVFATYAVSYLPSTDYIVALGSDGTIVEQGSFEELDAREGYVHELSIQGTRSLSSDDEEEASQPTKTDAAVDKLLTAQEDLARRTGDVTVYSHYAKSIGWFLGSIVVILRLGQAS